MEPPTKLPQNCESKLPSSTPDPALSTRLVEQYDRMKSSETQAKDQQVEEPDLLPEQMMWDLLSDSYSFSEDETLQSMSVHALAFGKPIVPDGDSNDHSDTRPSLKRQRLQYHSSTSSTPYRPGTIVGPHSYGMKAIERIFKYLEDTSSEDSKLLEECREIARQCQVRHDREDFKFLHLPGATFEMLVESLGGPTFANLYFKSKEHQHQREKVAEIFEKVVEIGLNEKDPRTDTTPKSRNCKRTYVNSSDPGVIATAVAYGMSVTEIWNGQATSTSEKQSAKCIVDDSVFVVENMGVCDRVEFWKTFLKNMSSDPL